MEIGFHMGQNLLSHSLKYGMYVKRAFLYYFSIVQVIAFSNSFFEEGKHISDNSSLFDNRFR